MKSKYQVNKAREKIIERLMTPGLSDVQKSLLTGALNALVWAADGPSSSTMERLLSNEPLAIGKDAAETLARIDRLPDLVRIEELSSLLRDIQDELSRSSKAAMEEDDQNGPWLPAGICSRIHGALGT